VIAHESCHIFGALDEYSLSSCNCTDKGGELQVENGNCKLCATKFVPCIMEANTLAMCDYTRGQLGWRTPLLRWNFLLQTGTGLHQTGDEFEFFFVDWDRDGIPDLVAVKKSGTGTGTTEVHIFSGASGFKTPILQTGTGLHQTDHTFQFCMTDWNLDGIPDLVAIKKSGTGTRTTEVHIFSGVSRFQNAVLHTGTGLHETDHTFAFGMARWRLTRWGGRPDLFAIKKSQTGTRSTEVHIFSAASGFARAVLQTGTPLHETDDAFDFLVAPFTRFGLPDVIAIKKRNTGTQSTEIHVLSGISRYQEFVEQSGSALHPTDQSFAFAPVEWDRNNTAIEIAAIKKQATGTGSTEVHILQQ